MLKALSLALVLSSCGPSAPATVLPATGSNGDSAFNLIVPILKKNCQKCHNGSVEPAFNDGPTFKASPALSFLQGGTMPPPPAKISSDDKAALISYLQK